MKTFTGVTFGDLRAGPPEETQNSGKFGRVMPRELEGRSAEPLQNFGKMLGISGPREEAGACAAEKGPGRAQPQARRFSRGTAAAEHGKCDPEAAPVYRRRIIIFQ